jgi:hypothetical protein
VQNEGEIGSGAFFLLYQLADGSIIGLYKDQEKSASKCTRKELSLMNGWIFPCMGFIDVNGKEGDNRIIKCARSSDTKNILDSSYKECTLESNIGDVIPIVFYDQTVEPATNAGRALFEGKEPSRTASTVSGCNLACNYTCN